MTKPIAAALVAIAIIGPHAQTRQPKYEVDAAWPKPLPNEWVLGGLGGLCVDAQDHVFILNRQDVADSELKGKRQAPPIIELDQAGNVVNAWGDPSLLDPRLHSCHADKENNIWIASSPSGMIQKYSHDGRTVLLQIGEKGVFDSSDGTVKGRPLNSNAARFFMPSSIYVDRQNGDVYVADGENPGGNQRVAVMDRQGKFLRQWRPEGMETVHCLAGTHDGSIYICNRQHSRIQIYAKSGSFIKSIDVPWTITAAAGRPPVQNVQNGGSAVALDFSPDTSQRLVFVINQNNSRIEVIDRTSGEVISAFGRSGHAAGEFDQPHGIAVDSRGNVYVAENRGRRVQRFVDVSGTGVAHER